VVLVLTRETDEGRAAGLGVGAFGGALLVAFAGAGNTLTIVVGVISAMAGVGGAAGPLIGGIITTTISWRASFFLQVPVAIYIVMIRSRIVDAAPPAHKPKLDALGAVMSAAGMTALVLAALLANTYGWVIAKKDFSIGDTTLLSEGGVSPVIILFGLGVLLLLAFAWLCDYRERHHDEPLVPTRILFDRIAVAGLVAQASQWFLLLGGLFIITLFLQQSLGLNAIQTGVAMMPAIIGLLLLSRRSSKLATKYSLRGLMQAGFIVAACGIVLVLLLADPNGSAWRLIPGLLLLGAGIGMIMPASVTFVQSTSPEQDQAAISGVSRSASNLGSSLGTAVAGSVLVVAVTGGASYERGLGFALITVAVASLIGLVATLFIPGRRGQPAAPAKQPDTSERRCSRASAAISRSMRLSVCRASAMRVSASLRFASNRVRWAAYDVRSL
jgi:MFS family permease